MHGAVMLDEAGEVVRPALIWCDQRTEKQSRELEELFGPGRLIELTLNPPLTNFTLTKLLWVRENEPENWKRVRHIMLPKDYVRFRLTARDRCGRRIGHAAARRRKSRLVRGGFEQNWNRPRDAARTF
jgi:xylulokinase